MDSLKTIWQRAQAGDRAGAQRDVMQVLRSDPQNVNAWTLLAALVDDPARKEECCHRILHIDPNNQTAQTLLNKLHAQPRPPQPPRPPSPPPAAAAPQPSPSLATTATELTCPGCGADLEVLPDKRHAACRYCGMRVDLTTYERVAESQPGGYTDNVADDEPNYADYEDYAPAYAAATEGPTPFAEDDYEDVTDEDREELARQRLVDYIVRELGQQANRNELIREICERASMSWPQAEKFVNRVAIEHEHEIIKKQSPFMIFIGIGTSLTGLVLTLVFSAPVVFYLFASATGQPADISPIIQRLNGIIGGIATGLSMFVGGIIGIFVLLHRLRESKY